MKVTAKEEAGLLMMVHLARLSVKGAVSLKDVADESQLSVKYLEKIVPDLRKAGLIDSERGVNGGYALTRGADTITVADVLRALNGDILSNQCVGAGLDDEPCTRIGNCFIHPMWNLLYARMEEVLEHLTLQDLLAFDPAKTKDFGAAPG